VIEEPPLPRAERAQAEASKAQGRTRKTEFAKDITKGTIAIGRLLYPEQVERPRTRADCDNAPRPCPYVACRHHLGIEIGPGGSIQHTHGDLEAWDLPWSCSLDLAEAEGLTLDQVAQAIGVTRERVRQIEVRALAKAVKNAKRLGIDLAALAPLRAEGFPSP
jgi:hypothetical protein